MLLQEKGPLAIMAVSLGLFLLPTAAISFGASTERERVLEGAKKEGRIVLYTGMDVEEANIFTGEFGKRYPFIKPEVFRSSGEKVLTRYLIESRANSHRADIFQTSIVQVYQLKKEGLLKNYISEEARFYPEGFRDREGYWNAFYLLTYVIGYNTNLVPPKEVPPSYEDLLNPRWKGLIGLETEEYQWFYHMLQIMGKDKGLDYMRRLAKQDLQMRKGHTLLAQLVAAGEMAMAVVVYANRVERTRSRGAPIDWVRFKSPTITAINAISIPEKAPHSNAAKLFVDFVLSKEGQKLLRDLRRIPARPDVPPDPPTLTKGLNLYPARPEGLIENYNETVAQVDRIFVKSK
jgi:iron(III) transport system substrate-binding protein